MGELLRGESIHLDLEDVNLQEEDLYEVDSSRKGWGTSEFLTELWRRESCRRRVVYIFLLGLCIVIELAVGLSTECLVLIAHSFRSCSTVFTVLTSVLCLMFNRTAFYSNDKYSYSYGFTRLEILCGFASSVFQIFLSLFVLFEAVEVFLTEEVPDVDSTTFISLVLVTLSINLIGFVLFRNSMIHATEQRYSPTGIRKYVLERAVYLGVISIVVILSHYIVLIGWSSADWITAIFISFLTLWEVIPQSSQYARVLLQTTPASIKGELDKRLREAAAFDKVLECRDEHFWCLSTGEFVGSLRVRVRNDADEQHILRHFTSMFRKGGLISHITIQIEKDDMPVGWIK